jgi:microcin C transport system substrate-binding protein
MTAAAGGLTRRAALTLAGAAAAAAALPPFAWAAGRSGLHGLSIFGDLKYPKDFKHFDFINPEAPKGGRMNFQPPNWFYNQSTQTFNTLNSFVLRGDSPPRMELIFDTLMASASDEPDSVYGLVAESVDVSEDANVYTFHLRPEARFHDGSKLTAEDVAWSLTTLKDEQKSAGGIRIHPNISEVIREMVKAEATDPLTVVVTFSGRQTRSTIFTVVGLPIFSKAYYAARPSFEAATLDPPLGSGQYKVGNLSAGRYIEFVRVPDYWGKDLPVNVGTGNFDTIRIDFFQERQAAFEAFKKGEITFREEFTSITWAKDYEFPAVAAGKVKKSLFPSEKRPSMQGWFFNTRRAKFRDPRTRLAIALAFDFEWTNRNLFFGSYERLSSYFQSSDFAASGTPSPDEVKLLEPFRADLPPEAFGEVYVPPKTDGSGRDRKMLRRSAELLEAAGWQRMGNQLVDSEGAPLEIEFLIDAQVFERVLSPYSQNLAAIGVTATIRQVDPAQYKARTDSYDFDIVGFALSLSATPLEGLEQIFSSRAADLPGSFNFSGIKEKAVDAILDRLPEVATRDQLVASTRAIDRVLRARHYWIENWVLANHRIGHWDLFGWPEKKPDYAFTPETTWWFDRDKASAIGMAG